MVKIISKLIKKYGIQYWKIKHKKYHFMLSKEYKIKIDIRPTRKISNDYFALGMTGLLIAKRHYCWNGSTMVPDFNGTLRASLIHDIGYQLMDLKLIKASYKNRKYFDDLFHDMMKEDKANLLVQKTYWLGVRLFGWLTI